MKISLPKPGTDLIVLRKSLMQFNLSGIFSFSYFFKTLSLASSG